VIAFDGVITTGLDRPRVAFRVTLMDVPVEFLSWKKVPPRVVATAPGRRTEVNAVLVR
jgi:hypothetical protein